MSNKTATTCLWDAACGALMTRDFHRKRVVTYRAGPFFCHVIEPEEMPKAAREVQGGRVHGGGKLARG